MTTTDTGIVVLAAGAASRFGSPKALARWGQSSLLSHVINICTPIQTAHYVVVLGSHADQVRQEVSHADAVFNPDWQKGMGTSIAFGVDAVLKKNGMLENLVVLPVDQPLVTTTHLRGLIALARQTQCCAFTRDGETWGVPAAVPRPYFPALQGLAGNKGLKGVLTDKDRVFLDGTGMLEDIDTPNDLERLRAMTATQRKA
jgi:molybdenum cofactor cytidylyltransferase